MRRFYRTLRSPRSRPLLKYPNITLYSIDDWPDLTALLARRKKLRRLNIVAPLKDVSSISEFAGLEELFLRRNAEPPTGSIDLARLPLLRKLELDRGVRVNLGGGARLEELCLEHPFPGWNDFLPTLPRLRTLTLVSPRTLPHTFPSSLRRLEIAVFRRWPDDWRFAGVEGLRQLLLEDVRGLKDLRPFSAIEDLEDLYAEDCEELVSLSGPALSPRYTEQLVGRTGIRTLRLKQQAG